MLPSICDIPDLIIKAIKDITLAIIGYFLPVIAIIAKVVLAIVNMIKVILAYIEKIKRWVEGGVRLFFRLLDIANSRSLKEACDKYNQLVADFGCWSGFQNVVDTLQLDCTKIPTFSWKMLCDLLDDLIYDEDENGNRVFRVLPKTATGPGDEPAQPPQGIALPPIKETVNFKSVKRWFDGTNATLDEINDRIGAYAESINPPIISSC